MEQRSQKRRLKGSVLFTVMAVLSIIIVFLMGTLVLAASSNRRAHKTFADAQTKYSARAASESMIEALKKNSDIADSLQGVANGTSASASFKIDFNGTGTGMRDVGSVEITKAGNKWMYNEQDGKKVWENKTILQVVATSEMYTGDSEAIAYLIYDPPRSPERITGGPPSPGVASFGSAASDLTSEFGGLSLGLGLASPGNFGFTNPHIMEAPIVVNGDLYINTNGKYIFPSTGTGMTVMGKLDFQNLGNTEWYAPNINTSKYSTLTNIEIPYIYAEKEIILGSQGDLGNKDGDMPLNIFCQNILAQSNGTAIHGNLYAYGEATPILDSDVAALAAQLADGTKTSFLSGTQNSVMQTWIRTQTGTGGTVATNGDFYTKGNLVIGQNVTITGDLYVGGNLFVNGGVKVNLSPTSNYKIAGGIYTYTETVTSWYPVRTATYAVDPTQVELANAVNGGVNNTGLSFPVKLEKNEILGNGDIANKIIKTPADVLAEGDPRDELAGQTYTSIPATFQATVDGTVYDGNVPDVITTSCTIKGGINKDIVIAPPSGNDLWICIENMWLQAGKSIMVDDTGSNTGTVNFFVKGTMSIEKGGIYSMAYHAALYNASGKYQLYTSDDLKATDPSVVDFPELKINVYSEATGANIHVQNLSKLCTAFIKAPYAAVSVGNPSETPAYTCQIYYNGYEIKNNNVNNARLCWIGCTVGSSVSYGNNWFLLNIAKGAAHRIPGSPYDEFEDAKGSFWAIAYYTAT